MSVITECEHDPLFLRHSSRCCWERLQSERERKKEMWEKIHLRSFPLGHIPQWCNIERPPPNGVTRADRAAAWPGRDRAKNEATPRGLLLHVKWVRTVICTCQNVSSLWRQQGFPQRKLRGRWRSITSEISLWKGDKRRDKFGTCVYLNDRDVTV